MMIETTKSVTTPKPKRFNTVAAIALKASSPVSCHTRTRRTGNASPGEFARLGEPPAFSDFQAISRIIRRNVPVAQLLARRLHVVIKHDDDDATVIMNQLLDLGIHVRTLLVVGFGTCRDEKFIEARIVPMRLVPGRSLGIDRGEHPVDAGTTVPVPGAPGFFQPDIVPVTVVGFTHDVYLDARRLRMLPIQDGRVDAAVESGVGGT